MSDGDVIFLRRGSELTVLRGTPYKTEADFQDALTQFPQVIAGVSTTGDGPVGLLLIKAEKRVPDADSAAMRIDHLFVDVTGMPVLVEVKRASDRRIYREVFGQLLEYAANGVQHWPEGSLRADFERQFDSQESAADKLKDVTGQDDVDSFWARVDENLRDGRIRLILVADKLPDSAVRIIEFLNEQMRDAEVLGVEVAQHVAPQASDGSGEVVYVPRLRGQTRRARNIKLPGSAPRPRWDRSRYMAETRDRNRSMPDAVALVEKLLDDTSDLHWGNGAEPGVGGYYKIGGKPTGVWELYGGGTDDRPPSLTISLGRLSNAGVNAEAVAARLKLMPAFADAVNLWRSAPTKQPSAKLDGIAADPEQMTALFSILHAVAATDVFSAPTDSRTDASENPGPQSTS